ncbi:flagellar export chaperone FliS [Litorilituus sediminis]|uniref:Flagellar secretion chaperone FliS n=1 Tax=Litorilituus sediminis TaxID=718192 RepID=A0A4P6P1N2_9GAMM|nr:flagellar export chaperone FliS [Litorilituus sediminis]QBG35226.1 flagellar export chaperone FliS [Litorilituus sediminis]
MRTNLKTYQNVNRESSLLAAEPHTIILMLFNGALESIAFAKGAIERKDFTVKAEKITKAVNIINSLRASLDKESQPQISANFDALYEYCADRLMNASATLNVAILDEVIGLLKPLRDAWAEMSEESKAEGHKLLREKEQQL